MEIGNWINKNRWRLLGMIMLGVAFLALYVTGVNKVNNLLQEIRNSETALESLEYQNQELQFQITTLESPDRINKVAIEKLGMVKPNEAPRVLK